MRAPAVVLLLSLALAGCASSSKSRRFDVPTTDVDGMILVPALVAAAEAQGLVGVNLGNAAEVTMVDGTRLRWHAVDGKFVLDVMLSSNVGREPEIWLNEAKATADAIWARAVQTAPPRPEREE